MRGGRSTLIRWCCAVAGTPAEADKSRMIVRLIALASIALPSACAPLGEEQLPSCWASRSYKDGQRIAGKAILLIGDHHEDQIPDGPTIWVAPLTCEDGSFEVLAPPPHLTKLSKAYSDGRELFGSAFEADIRGTVRLMRSPGHLSPENIHHLANLEVANLKGIARPRWWTLPGS
jgi:hypothetical protein